MAVRIYGVQENGGTFICHHFSVMCWSWILIVETVIKHGFIHLSCFELLLLKLDFEWRKTTVNVYSRNLRKNTWVQIKLIDYVHLIKFLNFLFLAQTELIGQAPHCLYIEPQNSSFSLFSYKQTLFLASILNHSSLSFEL